MGNVREVYTPKPLTATGLLQSGSGLLGGFFCTTSGTLQLRDGLTVGGGIIVNTFDVTEGVFHSMPFGFAVGLYAELGGGAQGTFAIGG